MVIINRVANLLLQTDDIAVYALFSCAIGEFALHWKWNWLKNNLISEAKQQKITTTELR